MRLLLGTWILIAVSLSANTAAGQGAPNEMLLEQPASQYARSAILRAGISSRPRAYSTNLGSGDPSESGHRVKHAEIGAGIGAGVGLVLGAAIGLGMDRHPGDGMIPATPFVAAEGLGIGLVVGLIAGAMLK
jgi:hypothetical protein